MFRGMRGNNGGQASSGLYLLLTIDEMRGGDGLVEEAGRRRYIFFVSRSPSPFSPLSFSLSLLLYLASFCHVLRAA